MENIQRNMPEVLQGFRNLTSAIDDFSPIDIKTKELILLGILTAKNATKGIVTHTDICLKAGGSKEEIISAIVYALPIVGVTSVTSCLDIALERIKMKEKVNEDN